MSRICKITGKRPTVANNVSNANNRTKKWVFPNIQTKTIFVPELNRSLKVRLSTLALRTINKNGLIATLKKEGLRLSDIL